jgi:hypothetical protein
LLSAAKCTTLVTRLSLFEDVEKLILEVERRPSLYKKEL